MATHRIENHPILPATPKRRTTSFAWRGIHLTAQRGETIAAALYAHGYHVFGHHPRDGSPQGLFCANGQCAQCLVLANGKPVKACMTPVTPNMSVEPLEGRPTLPDVTSPPPMHETEVVKTSVLILGGGPAGMSAAIELGEAGVEALLVDDKQRLGGKLLLQTHRFFGTTDAVYAGTRGIHIAEALADEVRRHPSVETWLDSTALAVFGDRRVGVLRGDSYVLVEPQALIVATGAHERSLAFPGNALPGVYGAGAFQTLVNRDRVRAAERLFIVGGGNVGLIAGYHALQAGIDVIGLVEVLTHCGGYKVHADKLRRLGVPIYTSHTILSAHGEDHVEAVTIAKVDQDVRALAGTARTFACDTILIAVGLNPVDEFTAQAQRSDLPVFDAGDAQAIAEASAAIFTGKIAGRRAIPTLGRTTSIPATWHRTAEFLKSRPGETIRRSPPALEGGVVPVLHCSQEIPCDPCTTVCPRDLIQIPGGDIRHVPTYVGGAGNATCIGCGRCIEICPGLAITLVDDRGPSQRPVVSLPYEFPPDTLRVGSEVTVVDTEGTVLDRVPVVDVRPPHHNSGTAVVKVAAPRAIATRIAGLRMREPQREPENRILPVAADEPLDDDAIICRCERVTAGEIRACIREGCRDLNELKAVTRVGMGACGGKTCTPLVYRIFREAGVPPSEVTPATPRPLFVETSLGALAGAAPEVPDT